MTSWPYFMTSYSYITSYLRTCQFYQKMSSFNVFQYKISNRMSYWQTFYDNFENFWNLNFQWEVTIKSGQYLLLIAGFDENEGDIRDQWWKLIDIRWWPSWFWKKNLFITGAQYKVRIRNFNLYKILNQEHSNFVSWLQMTFINVSNKPSN